MVCEKVAKMTQMRHDNLANALRLGVSACSCQSAAEPCYRAWLARRAWSNASAVVFVIAHASAAQAAKAAGWTAARAEGTKRTRRRQDVLDRAAFRCVTCGYMGKEAVKFV